MRCQDSLLQALDTNNPNKGFQRVCFLFFFFFFFLFLTQGLFT
jgi:hypothetical protein